MSLSGVTGRVLFSLFQQSYKGFMGKYFRVCASNHERTALDGFPLYWVEELKFSKAKTLDELSLISRETCQVLASLGMIFRFAGLLARSGVAGKVGPSAPPTSTNVPSTTTTPATPTPGSPKDAHNSPAPIEAIPLATVRAASPPAPLGGNEGVVHIESDEEEGFVGDPTFKRRKTDRVATSHSSSAKPPSGAQDEPPRSPSPPPHLALEEAVGTSAGPTPAIAPELPCTFQHLLRGWRQVESENLAAEDVMDESVHCILGNYLVRRHKHREQTAKEKLALVNEVAKLREELDQRQAVVSEVAHLKEEMARLGQHFLRKENALNEELRVVRNAEREANKKLHEQGQEFATLLSRVLPLRVELADLKDTLKEKEEKITTLEVLLGKVEGDLATCQQALEEKTEALAAHVEKAKEVEAELLTDGAEAYGAGFEDALA